MIKFGILGNPPHSRQSKVVIISGNNSFKDALDIRPDGVFGKYEWSENHNHEIELCKQWLRFNALPRKTANINQSSYSLKHVIEREVGQYISNGAVMRAAVELGYTAFWKNGLNCCFNMTFGVVDHGQTIIK